MVISVVLFPLQGFEPRRTDISNRLIAFEHLKNSRDLQLFLRDDAMQNNSFELLYFPEDSENYTYFEYDQSAINSAFLVENSVSLHQALQSNEPTKKNMSLMNIAQSINSICDNKKITDKAHLRENFFCDHPGKN